MSRLAPLLMSVVLALACDGGFRVKGSLSGAGTIGVCVLELWSEDRELLDAKSITTPFLETFIVAPGKHPYFFVVECEGYKPYRSKVFDLGGAEDYDRPLELDIKLEQDQ